LIRSQVLMAASFNKGTGSSPLLTLKNLIL
jgi:hypothetical protein